MDNGDSSVPQGAGEGDTQSHHAVGGVRGIGLRQSALGGIIPRSAVVVALVGVGVHDEHRGGLHPPRGAIGESRREGNALVMDIARPAVGLTEVLGGDGKTAVGNGRRLGGRLGFGFGNGLGFRLGGGLGGGLSDGLGGDGRDLGLGIGGRSRARRIRFRRGRKR